MVNFDEMGEREGIEEEEKGVGVGGLGGGGILIIFVRGNQS